MGSIQESNSRCGGTADESCWCLILDARDEGEVLKAVTLLYVVSLIDKSPPPRSDDCFPRSL